MHRNRLRPLLHLPALLLALAALAAPAGAQSLYDENRFRPLVSDRRALQVGDVLTVLVYENASSSNTAETGTGKSGSVDASIGGNTRTNTGRIGLADDFNGSGRIQRTGRLAAQLTVNVTEVLANGDLRVAGRQDIEVNGEKQMLQLQGRVRPVDVSDANTVVSTRLADAAITYVGDGILAEKQRPGLLTRFLSWLGLL